jgi:RecA-family ATPase
MEKLFCFHLARLLRMKKIDFSNKVDAITEEAISIQSNVSAEKKANPDILVKIDRKLSLVLKEMNETKKEEDETIKWRYAAIVMDKLFLYLSIIYSLIMFISIVMTIPGLYKFT